MTGTARPSGRNRLATYMPSWACSVSFARRHDWTPGEDVWRSESGARGILLWVCGAGGAWVHALASAAAGMVAVASSGTGIIRPTVTSMITQKAGRSEQGVILGLTQSLNSDFGDRGAGAGGIPDRSLATIDMGRYRRRHLRQLRCCSSSGYFLRRLFAQTARVPFVGCASIGQADPKEAPTGTEQHLHVQGERGAETRVLSSVIRDSGVLAPRGWYCLGIIGSSGSQLFVSPSQLSVASVPSGLAGIERARVEVERDRGRRIGNGLDVAEVWLASSRPTGLSVQGLIDLGDLACGELHVWSLPR